MITNVNGITILRDIIDKICIEPSLNDNLKQKIVKSCAEINYQMIKGRREIIQFDAFITSAIRFIYEDG